MLIRAARAGDAAAVAALQNREVRDSLITFRSLESSPDEIAAEIAARQAAGRAFLVAEAEGAVLGYASYTQFRANDGYRHAMEHTIVLAPAARRQGTGRALMAAIEAHARAAGHHCLIAGVSGANPEGVAFHAAMGFRQVAVLPQVARKWDRWLDLVVMQKLL